MNVDKHTIALISLIGNSLDLLGALYLAYDLLGAEHGPLRTVTRAVTYGVLYGTGYGLALGPVFGLVSGVAHGITLGWEFARASRGSPQQGFWMDTAAGAIRGVGFALGTAYLHGAAFGVMFGVLSTIGQAIAYRFGIRPTINYQQDTRPRVTRYQILAAINRSVGYTAAGYVSSLIAHDREHAMAVGMTTGLAIGVVTVIAGGCTPFVEWIADHMPARRMGVLGIGLILVGFGLQSVQYWAVILNVRVY